MKVFALADPHLSLATPNKSQEKFGPQWLDHARSIGERWRAAVGEDDLVLVAGDISWAMRLENAQADLDFLAALPGTKVLIHGNHDYWWSSISKVRRALRPRMYALQHDAIRIGTVAVCGTRLWDVPGVNFPDLVDWQPQVVAQGVAATPDHGRAAQEATESEKIYRRELDRLRMALAALNQIAPPGNTDGRLRIVMTHYPPCDANLNPTEVTQLFEQAAIDHAVFGHLHSLRRGLTPPPFGYRHPTHYHLTACDYLDFTPKLIATAAM